MTHQVDEQMPLGGAARDASVDAADVARFERLGAEWWDPSGPMGKLHDMNPVRIGYIRDAIVRHRPEPGEGLAGLRILDVGCGGGLLSEPLARLGARVTGVDPGETNIGVARQHAERAGLDIDYRAATAEDLVAGGERFDVVLAMEVVEHVVDRDAFMASLCALVKPGGLLFASTLNRTAKSYLLAIVGAEYVLRWLPRGTHRWSQFVTPEELAVPIREAGLTLLDTTGLMFDLLRSKWRLSRDMDVNYFVTARRPAE